MTYTGALWAYEEQAVKRKDGEAADRVKHLGATRLWADIGPDRASSLGFRDLALPDVGFASVGFSPRHDVAAP